jgi:hypothetical protein
MIETNTIVGTGMKVVTQRDELAQKLGVVARAVSTRASVQILSGVLLRAEAGRLHLAATDMELSLRSSLDAQVEGEGSVVVPGRLPADGSQTHTRHRATTHHHPRQEVLLQISHHGPRTRAGFRAAHLGSNIPAKRGFFCAAGSTGASSYWTKGLGSLRIAATDICP